MVLKLFIMNTDNQFSIKLSLPTCYLHYVTFLCNKGEVHPRAGDGGPEGKYRHSSILSVTSVLEGAGGSTPRPGRFTLGKDPAHCIGGWVGPRVALDGCGKSLPPLDWYK
jgi:hypothetical protein